MPQGRILVIEGNQMVRTTLCSHLLTRGYEVMATSHGVQAATEMRETLPHLILIDQDVPIGGVKTARILRLHPRYQRIPIIVAVAPKKSEVRRLIQEGARMNLEAFIAKPYAFETLEAKIAAHINAKLGSISLPDIRDELRSLTNLPVLSPVHQKMLNLLGQEDEEVDIRELVRTVESDQGLTTAVMRICHAAFYGFNGNTILTAITFLGIGEIRKMVQASIVFDIFAQEGDVEDAGGFSMMELWKHSVACGVIMEMGGRQVKGRDHFILGILHDIGKIIMRLRFPDHFAELRRIVDEEQKSMYQAERELLGLTHADIGFELARQWDLPDTISTCIAFHHIPSKAAAHKRLASLVHVSDITARSMLIGHGGDDQVPAMDDYAVRIARHMSALAERRDEITAQVESIVPRVQEGG